MTSSKDILASALRLRVGDGTVYVSGELQGRIFAELDGRLLHRLDVALAANPSPAEFNNLGGNSLWPAPEGGPFAFNYPPDGGAWYVQEGINAVPAQPLADGFGVQKTIRLVNRKGVEGELRYRRVVTPQEATLALKYGLKGLAYRSEDSFTLGEPLTDFLVAAWSLEQFDLTPKTFAFGKLAQPRLHGEFYSDPTPYIDWADGCFRFRFEANERLQVALPETAVPEYVGAVVPEYNLLIVRKICDYDKGVRIDIADNDQPRGPFAECDAYSIFYGPDARFFELETIAPVRQDADGRTIGSRLVSETQFYQGAIEDLKSLLVNELGFAESLEIQTRV